jgi:LysR family transcriptional regulator, regulator of the ytmI operon
MARHERIRRWKKRFYQSGSRPCQPEGSTDMSTRAIEHPNDETLAQSLRNLRTIVAIAETGSLTAAGARLGYSQATVSIHLAATEAALGVTLFRRHGRGVVATDAGRSLLQHAKTLFEAYAALRDDVLHTARHKLTFGAVESATSRCIVPLLKTYERDNPELDLTIRIESSIELCKLVESGALDIAIVSAQRGLGRFAKFVPLYEQELVVLAPAKHRLAQHRLIDLHDLHGERVILGDDRCCYRAFVESLFAQSEADVSLRVGFGNMSTVLASVSAGLGLSIVPRDVVAPPPVRTVTLRFRERHAVPIGVALRMDAPPSARRLATQISRSFISHRQRASAARDRQPRPSDRRPSATAVHL